MVIDDILEQLKKTLVTCRRDEVVRRGYEIMRRGIQNSAHDENESKLPTVLEFAKRTGLSRQTIQKIYNELVDRRIIYREPAKRLWYIRKPSRNNLKCIAVLLPAPFSQYYNRAAEYGERHFSIYAGINDQAIRSGVVVVPVQMIHPNSTPNEIAEWLGFLRDNFLGVIHLGDRLLQCDPPLEAVIRCPDFPQVSVDWVAPFPWGGTVSFDLATMLQNLCSYFYEMGHRKVCLLLTKTLSGPAGSYYAMSPPGGYAPFLESWREKFSIFTELELHDTDSKLDNFIRAFRKMQENKSIPSAIWCPNDKRALTLIDFLKQEGFRVPEDISIVGYDDCNEGRTASPSLTTFSNRNQELGYLLVSRLLDYAQELPGELPSWEKLVPIFYERQSSARYAAPYLEVVSEYAMLTVGHVERRQENRLS